MTSIIVSEHLQMILIMMAVDILLLELKRIMVWQFVL